MRDFHLPSYYCHASVPACLGPSRSFEPSRVQAGMHFVKVEAIRRWWNATIKLNKSYQNLTLPRSLKELSKPPWCYHVFPAMAYEEEVPYSLTGCQGARPSCHSLGSGSADVGSRL